MRAGRGEVRMTQLALDQRQRDALVRHLDSMRMAELVGREAPRDPRLERDLVQLQPGGTGRPHQCRRRARAAPERRLTRASAGMPCAEQLRVAARRSGCLVGDRDRGPRDVALPDPAESILLLRASRSVWKRPRAPKGLRYQLIRGHRLACGAFLALGITEITA
jgi:hypothetical protein